MDNQSLQQEIARLKSELEAKSDFISIMVHQLRTPLSAMKWIFKMMLDGDLGVISPEQKNIIDRGFASTNQMIDLLADVSAANHLSEWKMAMHPEPMDPVPCLTQTISEFIEEAHGKKINLSLIPPAKPIPQVLADKDKMCLVFQNLLENAIKYNRIGGSVTIRTEVFKDMLVVSVRDTGIGIPADEQKNIFGKFYRAQNAKHDEKGSGLGLFVAKSIVEANGGTIWFESIPDIGTTFFFSVPIAK